MNESFQSFFKRKWPTFAGPSSLNAMIWWDSSGIGSQYVFQLVFHFFFFDLFHPVQDVILASGYVESTPQGSPFLSLPSFILHVNSSLFFFFLKCGPMGALTNRGSGLMEGSLLSGSPHAAHVDAPKGSTGLCWSKPHMSAKKTARKTSF